MTQVVSLGRDQAAHESRINALYGGICDLIDTSEYTEKMSLNDVIGVLEQVKFTYMVNAYGMQEVDE